MLERKCRIRVLIADDSKLTRTVLRRALEKDADICVVAEAKDGVEAVDLALKLDPDVAIIDVVMPRKDGITAIKEIMERNPIPIIVFSSITQEGSRAAIEALEAGALEVIPKPEGVPIVRNLGELEAELRKKVRVLASVGKLRLSLRARIKAPEERAVSVPKAIITGASPRGAIAIASSTGGPNALMRVVPKLNASFPVALFIVQHMPPGFTKSLAERLDRVSRFHIKEAEDGEEVLAGYGYVAPGDYHMLIRSRRGKMVIELDHGPKIHGVRPAADPTFKCVAEIWGSKTVAVVLTGIGNDGAEGALEIRKRGGYVIAQDESTSVVWGMPKATIEIGAANVVLPIDRIAEEVNRVLTNLFPDLRVRA